MATEVLIVCIPDGVSMETIQRFRDTTKLRVPELRTLFMAGDIKVTSEPIQPGPCGCWAATNPTGDCQPHCCLNEDATCHQDIGPGLHEASRNTNPEGPA